MRATLAILLFGLAVFFLVSKCDFTSDDQFDYGAAYDKVQEIRKGLDKRDSCLLVLIDSVRASINENRDSAAMDYLEELVLTLDEDYYGPMGKLEELESDLLTAAY